MKRSYAWLAALVFLAAFDASSAEAQGQAPDGVWLGGGLNAQASFGDDFEGPDGVGVRLEAGIPMAELGPGVLGIALPFMTVHEKRGFGFGFGNLRYNEVTFAPELQWEFAFDLDMPHMLSISPYAGFGIGGLWFDDLDDGAFMILIPTGINVRFTFDFGLYVEVLPFGISFNIPFDDAFDFFAAYEFHATVGYRFGN